MPNLKEQILLKYLSNEELYFLQDRFGNIFKAMVEYTEVSNNKILKNTKQDKVYITYDKDDGNIYCAYLEEEICNNGCGMMVLRLINNKH